MATLLNLVLGLLLVYLVFAIVVSRLQEWLASVLGSRGKFLRDGVHRMIGESGLATRVLRHQLVSGLYRDRDARTTPPSYVEPASFALALANVLVRRGSPPETKGVTQGDTAAKVEATNQQLTYQNLRAALASFGAQRSPVAEALLPVVDRASDLDAALKGIEAWFSGGMDRVSGWYKVSARRRLFVIGSVAAALFNVDSIEIFRALNANPKQAAQMAAVAEDIGRTGQIAGVDIKALQNRSPNDQEWQALNAWLLSPNQEMRALPIGWGCIGAITSPSSEVTKGGASGSKPTQGSAATPTPATAVTSPADVKGSKTSSWDQCGQDFFKASSEMAISDWFAKILGWLLTAFAGSLGASYWFAAISKVINIRASGPPPEPTKKAA